MDRLELLDHIDELKEEIKRSEELLKELPVLAVKPGLLIYFRENSDVNYVLVCDPYNCFALVHCDNDEDFLNSTVSHAQPKEWYKDRLATGEIIALGYITINHLALNQGEEIEN